MDIRVLRPGLLEERDIGIGGLPEVQEVIVGHTGLRPIPVKSVGARQSEAGHRAQRKVQNDAAVIDDFLELRRRFLALPRLKVGLPAKVHGTHRAHNEGLRLAKLVRRSGSQHLDGPGAIPGIEFDGCPDGRQPVSLHDGVLWKVLVKTIGKFLCQRRLVRSRQRQRRQAPYVSSGDQGQRRQCLLTSSRRITKLRLAQGSTGLPQSGGLPGIGAARRVHCPLRKLPCFGQPAEVCLRVRLR